MSLSDIVNRSKRWIGSSVLTPLAITIGSYLGVNATLDDIIVPNAYAQQDLRNTKIAYAARNGIYVMDIDGKNQINLTKNNGDFDPAWSPDGNKIAFTSNRDGEWEIYMMNIDGTNLINLTNNHSNDSDPSWSPDGRYIAFVSDRDRVFDKNNHIISEIYVMNVDGSNARRLTNNDSLDGSPTWSPDGSNIAFDFYFIREVDPRRFVSKYGIYIMNFPDGLHGNIDGQDPNILRFESSHPGWSIDDIIAFSSDWLERNTITRNEILSIKKDGTNIVRLTNNPDFDFSPTWSPDGTMIAYTSYTETTSRVSIMDRFGNNQIVLIESQLRKGWEGKDLESAWSPFLTPEQFEKLSPDKTSPYTQNLNPSKGATNIDPTTNIYLEVKDNKGVNEDSLELIVDYRPIPKEDITITQIQDGFSLLYNPPKDFYFGDRITIKITARDINGNELRDEYSFDAQKILKGLPSSKIAYASGSFGQMEIYVMDSDGIEQRLTNDPPNVFPQWSPDGKKIIFTSNRDENSEIYVMDIDGSNQINLTNRLNYDFDPVWSPNGKKIAFASAEADDYAEIYIMDSDGRNQTKLTENPFGDGYDNLFPMWSPDGSRIAFVSEQPDGAEIYVMDSDGKNQTNLSNFPEDSDSYSFFGSPWSPDGKKIVFSSLRDFDWEIYVMNSDGSNQTNLTKNPDYDENPVWSPDGSKIVFISDRGERRSDEIYIMNADGTNQTRLTDLVGNVDHYVWSPNGSEIAFVTRVSDYTTCIINSDGTNLRRLSDNAVTPTWFPSDTIFPYLGNQNPEKDAKNIAPNSNIYIEVKDDRGIEKDSLEMIVNGIKVVPEIKPIENGFSLTYDPSKDFAIGQTVNINIKAKDIGGNNMDEIYSFEIQEEGSREVKLEDSLPSTWAHIKQTLLLQNYPNPANPETWIPFALASSSDVDINIYDLKGRLVKHLDLGYQPAGIYRTRDRAAHWDGRNDSGEKVASGLYMVDFQAGNYRKTERVVIGK